MPISFACKLLTLRCVFVWLSEIAYSGSAIAEEISIQPGTASKIDWRASCMWSVFSPELSDVRKVVNISSQEEQGEEKEFPQDMTWKSICTTVTWTCWIINRKLAVRLVTLAWCVLFNTIHYLCSCLFRCSYFLGRKWLIAINLGPLKNLRSFRKTSPAVWLIFWAPGDLYAFKIIQCLRSFETVTINYVS